MLSPICSSSRPDAMKQCIKRHEKPRSTLDALVGKITAEIDSLNAAVAVLNEARDAAPCPPSRSSSPLGRRKWRPTRLPPILEEIPAAPDVSTSSDAPACAGTDFDMNTAATPRPGACAATEDRKREPSLEARGRLTLKASADHKRALNVMCSIDHGMLMLASCSGGGAPLSQVPIKDLAVGVQPGRENMFVVATLHNNTLFDKIFCFADDQAERDEWIAVFRRMGVLMFDLSQPFDRRRVERLLLQRSPFDNANVLAKRFKKVWGNDTREN
jgi:hypothetical protein